MKKREQRVYRVLILVRKALEELNVEIARHRAGEGRVSEPHQLERFRQQLVAMEKELQSGNLTGNHVGMGRAIVDSWSWDSPLSELLLAAEQQYLELLR